MCGIAGGVNRKLETERLKNDLGHRGPDAFGSFREKNLELFHARLAIQDIAGGAQPMERDDCVIIFNGEIYNHLDLRQKLLTEHHFTTRSDTETLLRLYQKFGERMFDEIDGMFAFVIFDRHKNELFFAVDRAGEKPLYLYRKGNVRVFASELGAIARQCETTINEEAINAYLRIGFFPKEITPYKEIERLENGTWLRIDLETLKEERGRYFSMEALYRERMNEKVAENEALNALEKTLKKSVYDRLLSSDLEVGAFLSGGIDSSLVVSMASQFSNRLKTFTVAFDGGYDESPLAELTAKKYHTDHHTLRISMNLKEDAEKILYSYGQPFMDSSAIPSWYVSRSAKEHVTVVLNGDGADELFGGYRRYVPIANGWLNTVKFFSFLKNVLPKPHEKQSHYNYFYRMLSMAGKEGLDFYLGATTDIFEEEYRFGANTIEKHMDIRIRKCSLIGLEKMLCLDFEFLLFSDLLIKMDIATMAHSLEARSPFLGKKVLELAAQLPSKYKIRGTTTKWILRKLAEKYLPEELIRQPKRGFEVPLKRWVDQELWEPIQDRLAPGAFSERFVGRKFIDDLLKKRLHVSAEKRAKMLWSLYALEVWKKNR